MHLPTPEIRAFLEAHVHSDPYALLLKPFPLPGISASWLVQQLIGRQKAKHKLPQWYANPNVVYPKAVSMEQCSSEATAAYKAGLFAGGKMAVDLTGGFGADSAFLAHHFQEVIHVEPDAELSEIAAHNFAALGLGNIRTETVTAETFLADFSGKADLFLIDPSRRDQQQRKVFFADCEPNLLEIKSLLQQKGSRTLVKAAPMLDISQAWRELGAVAHTWVVALADECKELLFELDHQSGAASGRITCVNLGTDCAPFAFDWAEEQALTIECGMPSQFLYEPHAGIMKAGAFKTVAHRFEVQKLHPHTHLYTAAQLVPDFPGRAFQIRSVEKVDKKAVQARINSTKANMNTRNFPISTPELRKKLQLSEGGDSYLFGVTLMDGSRKVLTCNKTK